MVIQRYGVEPSFKQANTWWLEAYGEGSWIKVKSGATSATSFPKFSMYLRAYVHGFRWIWSGVHRFISYSKISIYE